MRRAPERAPSRSRLPWLAVAALVALAGAVAASNLTVNQKADVSTLFAERYAVDEAFVLEASALLPAHETRGPRGVDGAAIEMTGSMPEAFTVLTRDQWAYSVTVKEASAGRLTSGNYTVDLFVDEVLVGSVHLRQDTPQADEVEGARVSFGIGNALSTSALYYVVVKPVVDEGDVVEFALDSVDSDGPKWRGAGGDLNPSVSVAAGDTLRIVATNADDGYHNVGIKDASGAFVAPAGATQASALPHLTSLGDEVTLSWRAASGTFTYVCTYHESQGMKGTITVE